MSQQHTTNKYCYQAGHTVNLLVQVVLRAGEYKSIVRHY